MTYYGATELARSFRTVRRNTLVIAAEITEDRYGFRAVPETRSVAETLAHIAMASQGSYELHAVRKIPTFVGIDFRALAGARQEGEKTLTAKADIVAALEANGEAWGAFLDAVTEEELAQVVDFPEPVEPRTKSRFELLLGVKEHEMHHRAQLMVLQRLLGLVPHLTRERQSRMASPKA